MRQASRRQILADLGITWWHLRVPPGAAPAVSAEGARAAAGAPDQAPSAAARAALEAASPAPAPEAARAGVGAAPGAVSPESAVSRRGVSDVPAAQPFAVQSLALGAVVLLVGDLRSRRDQRLARDVLAAAAGDYVSRPSARRFSWPPDVTGDVVAGDADSGNRALRAFVDKDIADHGARLLLCVAPVASRLGEGWPGCRRVTLPDLAVLGCDVAAKRALWKAVAEPPV